MIIVQLRGGLGNQMFQYAFACNLAKINNTELIIDSISNYRIRGLYIPRPYLLGDFNINKKNILQDELNWAKNIRIWQRIGIAPKWIHLQEKKFDMFQEDAIKKYKKNVYVIGFWQNEQYFSTISSVLKKEFTINKKWIDNYDTSISSLNSVAVHVRRGDYISNAEYGSCYVNLNETGYYNDAIEMIKQKIKNPVFFIFSDDMKWCKEHFKVEGSIIIFIENTESALHDFSLMSQCKHQIIANSTFSWWAAWLNNNPQKIVICPNKWFVNNWNDSHYALPEWIKL